MMPGEHVFMPEIDWLGAGGEALVEHRQEPPRFAVGQLWRTRGGELRSIIECDPDTGWLPITTAPASGLGVNRLHASDGTHRKIGGLDLVERINTIPPRPGFTWSWSVVFWGLVALAAGALAGLAEGWL
jgi:hypothetical protein